MKCNTYFTFCLRPDPFTESNALNISFHGSVFWMYDLRSICFAEWLYQNLGVLNDVKMQVFIPRSGNNFVVSLVDINSKRVVDSLDAKRFFNAINVYCKTFHPDKDYPDVITLLGLALSNNQCKDMRFPFV